jgi:pimeloyl-ACP methyl ester carboxylesterase
MKKKSKLLVVTVSVIIGLFILFFIGAGWYFSEVLYNKAFNPIRPEREKEARVVQIDDKIITLESISRFDKDFRNPGIYGIEWDGGFGRITDVISSDDRHSTRLFSMLEGNPPTVGTTVIIDANINPRESYPIPELPSEEVSFHSKLGNFLAYFTGNKEKTWIILVHGNGMVLSDTRNQALSFYKLGYPTLTISYRNDKAQPKDPSNVLQYGLTEWNDLEGAVRYALEQGSENVILFGLSMGGGIVLNFMYKSELKNKVKGLILDSPILDFGKAVDISAGKERLPVIGLPVPQALVDCAKVISALRFPIKWNAINYLASIDRLAVPILLFHGTADITIPVVTSDTLAQKRKDIIYKYMRCVGADHTKIWNYDRQTYERNLADFLASVKKT